MDGKNTIKICADGLPTCGPLRRGQVPGSGGFRLTDDRYSSSRRSPAILLHLKYGSKTAFYQQK
jgi:hypothetical protein